MGGSAAQTPVGDAIVSRGTNFKCAGEIAGGKGWLGPLTGTYKSQNGTNPVVLYWGSFRYNKDREEDSSNRKNLFVRAFWSRLLAALMGHR